MESIVIDSFLKPLKLKTMKKLTQKQTQSINGGVICRTCNAN